MVLTIKNVSNFNFKDAIKILMEKKGIQFPDDVAEVGFPEIIIPMLLRSNKPVDVESLAIIAKYFNCKFTFLPDRSLEIEYE